MPVVWPGTPWFGLLPNPCRRRSEGPACVRSAYHVVLAVKTLRAGLRPVLGESSSLRYDESW